MVKRSVTPSGDTAYRGYLIRRGLLGEEFYVQRDGFTIATVTSVEAAKRAIDEVVG